MAHVESPKPSPERQPITISLETCPPVFVLPTHLSLDELHEVEEVLTRCKAPLTYDITEAVLVIGNVTQKKRAALELRSRGLWTEEVPAARSEPPSKRRRIGSPVPYLDAESRVMNLDPGTEHEA